MEAGNRIKMRDGFDGKTDLAFVSGILPHQRHVLVVTFGNVPCLFEDCGSMQSAEQHACPSYAAQPWDNSALAHQAVKSIPELLSQTDHWLDL